MSSVLNPAEPANFLCEEELLARAEIMVTDWTLAESLAPENIDEITARFEAALYPLSRTEVRSRVVLEIVSLKCLEALMGDGLGRSEFHIAGEICRIKETFDMLQVNNNYPFQVMKDLSSLDTTAACEVSLWQPEGTCFPCPTIDGRSVDARYAVSKGPYPYPVQAYELVLAHSRHHVWGSTLLSNTLPELARGKFLRRLHPPFIFETGELETREIARYYKLKDEHFVAANVPQQLMTV